MTKGQVLLDAQALGVRLNELTIKDGNSPVVVLLAIRMFEKTLTASMRRHPEAMALANELWRLIEPQVTKASAALGMSSEAD